MEQERQNGEVEAPRRPMTRTEAARRLGITRRQLDKAIKLGEAKTIPFAGRDLMTPSQFDHIAEMLR